MTPGDDEHVETRWHALPPIPASSWWVSPRHGDTPIRLHAGSIASGYASFGAVFAAVLAMGAFAAAHFTIGGVLLVTAGALAWLGRHRWRASPRTARFHRAIYGIACPPALLPRAVQRELRAALAAQWPAIAGAARTPEDVARLGARTGDEAAAAYMLLALAGARADAARIADGTTAPPADGDGPFRGVVVPDAGARVAPIALARAPERESSTIRWIVDATLLVGTFCAGLALIADADHQKSGFGPRSDGQAILGFALAFAGPAWWLWQYLRRSRARDRA